MVLAVTSEVRSGVQGRPSHGEDAARSRHADMGDGTQAGLCVGAARSGLHGGVCELHSALLRALDTPDAGERWARGEKVFADCRVPVEYCGPGLPLPVLRQ